MPCRNHAGTNQRYSRTRQLVLFKQLWILGLSCRAQRTRHYCHKNMEMLSIQLADSNTLSVSTHKRTTKLLPNRDHQRFGFQHHGGWSHTQRQIDRQGVRSLVDLVVPSAIHGIWRSEIQRVLKLFAGARVTKSSAVTARRSVLIPRYG